jgi:hypothetical protein
MAGMHASSKLPARTDTNSLFIILSQVDQSDFAAIREADFRAAMP